MVGVTAEKNRAIEKIKFLQIKKEECKKKLTKIKDRLITSHFHEQNLIKNLSPDMVKGGLKKVNNYQQ